MSPSKLGRYDLLRVLGRGAMGLVYEGHDPNLNRRVAIKTIQVEYLSQEAGQEYEFRFRTEAHSAARLQHPNIVSVYDADRDGGVAYLVMEFIQGKDLKQHLDSGVVYSLEQSISIVSDLLSALDYAHQHNIVHRDIKPANLLVQANGRVKLTDFGVARLQDTADMTHTQGVIVGTLKYMSPEQVQGLPLDSRADLFSVGVVLYQLLTNHRPFDGGSDFAIIHEIIDHQPSAPSSFNVRVSPELDAVVAKALAKLPDQRFATAREFALALQIAVKGSADYSLPLQFRAAEGSSAALLSLVDNYPTALFEPTQQYVSPGLFPAQTHTHTQTSPQGVDVELDDLSVHSGVDSGSLLASGSTASIAPQSGPTAQCAPHPMGKPASKPTAAVPKRLSGKRVFTLCASLAVVLIGLCLKLPWLYDDETVNVLVSSPVDAILPQATASAAMAAPLPVNTTGQSGEKIITEIADSTTAMPEVPVPRQPIKVVPPALLRNKGVTGERASTRTMSSTVSVTAPKSRVVNAEAMNVSGVAGAAVAQPQPVASAPLVVSTSARKTTAKPLAPPESGSPEDACVNRILLGRYSCMTAQCAKPLFQTHPACIEQQQIEQRRRDRDAQRY